MDRVEEDVQRIINQILWTYDGYETNEEREEFQDRMSIRPSQVREWRGRGGGGARRTPPGRPVVGGSPAVARHTSRGRSRPPRGPRSAE